MKCSAHVWKHAPLAILINLHDLSFSPLDGHKRGGVAFASPLRLPQRLRQQRTTQSNMTKSQELELFRNLVSAFPDDSYIGEWLRQVDAEVESNLRSDIIPMISLRDSTRQCEAIVANANQRAASIVRQAEAQAESIVRRRQTRRGARPQGCRRCH